MKMRGHWLFSALSVIISMGTTVVLVGQYQQLVKVQMQNHRKEQDLGLLTDRVANHELFAATLGKLEIETATAVEELEEKVSLVQAENEGKKKEMDVCLTNKKSINDELTAKAKENEEFNAKIKSDHEAWKKEIAALEETLKKPSPICSFVKNDPLVQKLCGIVVTTTAMMTTTVTTG